MLRNTEYGLYSAIGKFSTIGGLANSSVAVDTPQATQCTAFLCSSREFTWFIESWDVNRSSGDLIIENKKVYPAKVTGLNLTPAGPLLDGSYTIGETIYWKEGLIGGSGNFAGYRPGFGQVILSDTSRPDIAQFISQNDLLGTGVNLGWLNYRGSFSHQLGRLMSMAFYVDPIAAAKYDASNSTKKEKSLNSQDYEQMPTYPTYDIPTGGY